MSKHTPQNFSNKNNRADIELVANEDWKTVELNGETVEIPDEWNIDNIGKKINFVLGNTPPKVGDNYKGDTPWVTISNVSGSTTNSWTAKINPKKAKVLPRGSLIGSFKMSVGRFSILEMDAATNEAIVGVSPEGAPGLDLNYLRLALVDPFVKSATTNGQGVKLLNTKTIKSLDFLSPIFAEQTLIAETLTAQEDYIASLREQAALERQRLEWLSDELLSGRLRVEEDSEAPETIVSRDADGNPIEVLPGVKLVANQEWKTVELNGETVEIPQAWDVEKIRKNCFVSSGGTPVKNDLFYDGEIPWITTTDLNETVVKKTKRNITQSGLENSSAKKIKPGSVLIAMYGASIGKMGISGIDATTNQSIASIFSEIHSNEYLFNYLLSKKYELSNLSSGSGQPNISQGIVSEFEMLIPEYKEQTLIALLLNKQKKQIEETLSVISVEKNRLDWLSDELLSGRIRVRAKE